MKNCWKFCALFLGDFKSKTADLFVGVHHEFSLQRFVNQNNCKILVHYSDGSFVAQKLLWEVKVAQNRLQHKKLLKILKVAMKVLRTTYALFSLEPALNSY